MVVAAASTAMDVERSTMTSQFKLEKRRYLPLSFTVSM